MKVIAIANQKGGVGKTTVCAGLAGALRERGRFVALLDLDPQGCLSLLSPGVEQIQPRDLTNRIKRLRIEDLTKRLERLAGSQDYVLLDTPPSLGEATMIALKVSDGVVIPTLPEYLALRGLGNLLAAIEPTGKVIGFVVVAYRAHVRHHRRVLAKIEEIGHPILATIPFTISVSDAGLVGKSVTSYSPAKSRGVAAAYQELTEAVEQWAKT